MISQKPKRKSWSNNTKVIIDGIKFDSKLEGSVYMILKLLQRKKEISNIRFQQEIFIAGKLKLRADFVVFDENRKCDVAHEAKGREFPRFIAQKQAWEGTAPMDLVIWKGTELRPFIEKTIKGKL